MLKPLLAPPSTKAQAFMPEVLEAIGLPKQNSTAQSYHNLGRADSIADMSTLSWVDALLEWTWPKVNTALMQFVHNDLTFRLQEAFPAPFKNAHFSRFTLGQNTPELGPIEVIRHSDTHIEIDLGMRYFSDVDILLDAGTGGISLGVKQLTFTGRLCVVLQPLLEKLPVIGAIKIFFAAPPQMTLKFTGLAAVAHYPGIEERIQRAVDELLINKLVLPNRAVFLNAKEEDVDLLETLSQVPLGVLRVRVQRGRNLAGVNWSALDVDYFTSHPYCVTKLGAMSSRTSTVIGSTNPIWPSNEPSAYFIVYHRDQRLEIDVFGEDKRGPFTRNFTGFLGCFNMSVYEIMKLWPEQDGKHQARVALDTAQVSKDMLHVNDPVNTGISSELDIEAEWFEPLSPVSSKVFRTGNNGGPVAMLLVELHKGAGFPTEAISVKGGLRWRSKVETSFVSRRGELCDVEQLDFLNMPPINPRLFPVIDKLTDRGFSRYEIAEIIDAESPELITLYWQAKHENNQKQEALATLQRQDDYRISIQWYEVISILIYDLNSANLTLELLDDEDHEIGCIGPLPLKSILASGGKLEPATHALSVGTTNGCQGGGGGLVSWLMQPRTTTLDTRRFASVQMRISAQLQFLESRKRIPHRGQKFYHNAGG